MLGTQLFEFCVNHCLVDKLVYSSESWLVQSVGNGMKEIKLQTAILFRVQGIN